MMRIRTRATGEGRRPRSRRARPFVVTVALASALALLPVGAVADDVAGACDSAPASGFDDVAAGATHAAGIDCMADYGVVTGREDGTFGSSATLTRGQAASMLVAFAQVASDGTFLDDASEGSDAPFGDLDGSVHAAAVTSLWRLGLVTGTSETTFSPGEVMTREQFSSLLYGVHIVLGTTFPEEVPATSFTDIDGSVHAEAIAQLAAAGVVRGVSEDRFAPASPVLRGQAASLLAGAAEVLAAAGAWSPSVVPPEDPEGPEEPDTPDEGDDEDTAQPPAAAPPPALPRLDNIIVEVTRDEQATTTASTTTPTVVFNAAEAGVFGNNLTVVLEEVTGGDIGSITVTGDDLETGTVTITLGVASGTEATTVSEVVEWVEEDGDASRWISAEVVDDGDAVAAPGVFELAGGVSEMTVDVLFLQTMDPTTVTDPLNYEVDGDVSDDRFTVELDAVGRLATLTFADVDSVGDVPNLLEVGDVRNVFGRELEPESDRVFELWPEGEQLR